MTDLDARSDAQNRTAGLRLRRAAACRLPPLPDGRRDPLEVVPSVRLASTFGLTEAEVLAEARRLARASWAPWEIARVLDLEAIAS